MATPVFACGFECQSVAHWGANAYVTVQNTYARNSGYALRLTTSGQTGYLERIFDATSQVVVFRAYVYLLTAASEAAPLFHVYATSGYDAYVMYDLAQQKFSVGNGTTHTLSTELAYTGQWYRFDVKVDGRNNPVLIDWAIDGTDQTQHSVVNAATTYGRLRICHAGGATSHDTVFDDVVVSQTLDDYPLGAGEIVGYRVTTTSGTHNQTTGDLQNEASSNVSDADSSGGKVNEAAPDTTSYVKQVVARSTTYWEGIYDTSGATQAPRSVEQVVATRAVSAGANDQKAQLYDGSSAADAYALTSTPNTSLTVHRKMWAAAPSTGAWTLGKLQAARIRWGFGTTNTATYPPAISYTTLEADYSDEASAAPTWVSPADGEAMSTTPVLQFTIPSAASAIHFYLELDTADTFDTGNLRTYRSDSDQTNWTYYDGDSWEAVPAGGVPITYIGNDARYTVTSALSSGTWYRRVRAST